VPVPSKSIGIYAVFIMLQDVVSICEKDKNTVFTMFLLPERGEIAKKMLRDLGLTPDSRPGAHLRVKDRK